jgi:serine protease Do
MRCAGAVGARSVLCGLLLAAALPVRAAPPEFAALVRSVRDAVVNISTIRKIERSGIERSQGLEVPAVPRSPSVGEMPRGLAGPGGGSREVRSLGSGFIISPDGYILTDYHVVKGARQVLVRLIDRREFKARVIGGDRRSDIALLKIDADHLPAARIGRSANLEVGQWVLAIGSPFGFDYSVTAGIVSATGRSLVREDYVPLIQTDVATNPGDSGGPLFNLKGKVVGVSARIYSAGGGSAGVSFAVPIEVAMNVAGQLRATGYVTRGWLGVVIQDVNEELARSFGLSRPMGALVARVLPGTPAARAGIRVGDVIVAYDGHAVVRSAKLPSMVGPTKIGSRVPVTVIRDGKPVILRVRIATLPERPRMVAARTPGRAIPARGLGVGVTALPVQRRTAGGGDHGVLVTTVGAGPALRAGVRRGDVLLMVDGVRIEDPEQFARVSAGLPRGAIVPVLVQRRKGAVFLAVSIPKRNSPNRAGNISARIFAPPDDQTDCPGCSSYLPPRP